MRSKLLVILPALALALSGCKKESVEGPLPGCLPAGVYGSTCAADSECCSFACEYGVCMPNPVEGGVCRTNSDCQAPRLCVGGHCATTSCNPGVACTPGTGAPCCTGTCSYSLGTYSCPVDRPPVAVASRTPSTAQVPWHRLIQLSSTGSNDPDGGGLTYQWSASPTNPGTLTFVPSASYPNPTVVPNAVGVYSVTLTVLSANRSASANLTFEAVNTVPTATMDPYMAATTKSRNVPFQFSVPIYDEDGGPVTCEWWKLAPPPATDPELVSSTMCAAQTGGAASGTTTVTLNEDLEGIWTMRLVTSDGEPANDREWNRYITVVNDRPTIDAMPDRVGNFGAPGQPAPAIPLHATARDVNGDVSQPYFTYSWRLTSTKPAAEERPAETEIGTGPDAQFVPSAVGPYVIRVDVDDQHTNGTQSAFVDVLVEPYILPLGEVIDAAHDKGSNKIVAIGNAVGGGSRLWVIDPSVPRIVNDLALASTATCVTLSPDGTEALVGESGGYQRVTNVLTSPAVQAKLGFYVGTTRQSGAVAADIVHVGNSRGFAVDTGGNIYVLDLTATVDPSGGAASCPGCSSANGDLPSGRRAVATTANLWLLNTGRLSRYDVHPSNGNLSAPVIATPPVPGTSGLWLGAGGAQLFTSTPDVFDAATLASTARLSSAPDHVDTTITSGLKGVTATWTSTLLSRFDDTFADTGTLQLPQLGKAGTGYANYGRFVFVNLGETGFYAVVRANTASPPATNYEWGLVKLP